MIQQGALEQANVAVADEMVAMIQTSREFEANQESLEFNESDIAKSGQRIRKDLRMSQ